MVRNRHTPEWIKRCPKPWVVVDWGVLRALPANSGIPGTFTALIHDRVFVEILGSDHPEEFRRKLDQIIVHPQSLGRILVGRYWNDIVDEERSPRQVIPGSAAAIDIGLSNALRIQQQQGRTFLGADTLAVPSTWVEKQPKFVGLMNRYMHYMRESHPELIRQLQSKTDRTRLIQLPTVALAESVLQSDSRYRSREWRSTLSMFPDICAIGRWLRVMTWYAMHRVSAADERVARFGQNYDDAHYVFLSLYTRYLWTVDIGMRDAVTAVSGGQVRVLQDWMSVPKYA